jgi:hypothetical protein
MTEPLILAASYLAMTALTQAFYQELHEYDLAIQAIVALTTVTVAIAHFNTQAYLASLTTLALLGLPAKTSAVALGALTFFLEPVLGLPLLVTQATRLAKMPRPRLYAATFLMTGIILLV